MMMDQAALYSNQHLKENIVKKIIYIIASFLLLFGLASIGEAKDGKKRKKEYVANEQKTKEPAAKKNESASKDGWIAVNINQPEIAKAEYRVDGGTIELRFTNLVDDTTRVKYSISWEEKIRDAWEKGERKDMLVTIRGKGELPQRIRAQSNAIRNIIFEADVVMNNNK